LVVSGDAFGEEESFSGDAGGVVLSFQGDAVCAFLGLGALPGRHHQPTVGLRGTRRFGQNQLAGGCGQCGEEQGAAALVVYTCPEGAVQMTVPSGNFLGYRRQQGEANCRRFGVTLAPCVRLMRSKPSPSKCSANASAPVNL